MADTYDVAILGGGNAGYAAALRAAQLGLSVALVEERKVGGTCLHRGCIPTKALLHSAEVTETIRHSENFGVISEEPRIDWGKVLSYKDSVVSKLHKGLEHVIKQRKVVLVNGKGRLADKSTIELEDGTQVKGKAVILATGSFARTLPFIEIDGKAFITSDHALELESIPSSFIAIGSGAVGMEFASVFRTFGAEVTVIEALPRVAPGEDEEVSKEFNRQFQKRGIKCVVGAKVSSAEVRDGKASVSYEVNGKTETVTAEHCLVAVGRGPVSEGLGFEEAGVKVGKGGFVEVDASCATGVEGVWPVGDLITQPKSEAPFPHLQLAHVAFAEGVHVAEQIGGIEDSVPLSMTGVPRCTYTTPEVASVGLTEQQAKDAGHEVKVAKFPWAASGKATILGESAGFVKVVAKKDGGVLGVHMIGPRVTELIAEAQLITNWEAYPSEVAALFHPHPTLSEALGESMLHLAGKQLHGA